MRLVRAKYCPCCGSDNIVYAEYTTNKGAIICHDCNLKLVAYGDHTGGWRKNATKKWNARAEREKDARAYELLKAALDIFEQQRDRGYWDAIACTAKYDGTDCDVFNLYADITVCLREHDDEVKNCMNCSLVSYIRDGDFVTYICDGDFVCKKACEHELVEDWNDKDRMPCNGEDWCGYE